MINMGLGMDMANINVRIDEKVKKAAEKVFNEVGITASTAINMFYKQVIRTNSIPFEIKAEVPNKKTLKALKEVEDMEKHPDKSRSYKNVDELMKDLLKQ